MTHIPTPTIQLDGNNLVGPMGDYYGTLTGANPMFADRLMICVNNHDSLVAALREIVTDPALIDNAHRFDEWMDKARAALAALEIHTHV